MEIIKRELNFGSTKSYKGYNIKTFLSLTYLVHWHKSCVLCLIICISSRQCYFCISLSKLTCQHTVTPLSFLQP